MAIRKSMAKENSCVFSLACAIARFDDFIASQFCDVFPTASSFELISLHATKEWFPKKLEPRNNVASTGGECNQTSEHQERSGRGHPH